jgi:hypothetical protein
VVLLPAGRRGRRQRAHVACLPACQPAGDGSKTSLSSSSWLVCFATSKQQARNGIKHARIKCSDGANPFFQSAVLR